MLNEIFLVLVLAPGPYSYQSFGALNPTMQSVQDNFAAGGLSLSFRERYYARENARFLLPLKQRFTVFQRIKAWKRRQLKLRNRLIHVFLPPSVDPDGTRWIWGIANTCNPRSGLSVSVALETNKQGEPRQYQSIVAASHEIAHTLGARHNPAEDSIMHEDAIRLSTIRYLSFDSTDRKRISQCLKAWRFE